jgi:outer membrane receptor protein involved in Fe transport
MRCRPRRRPAATVQGARRLRLRRRRGRGDRRRVVGEAEHALTGNVHTAMRIGAALRAGETDAADRSWTLLDARVGYDFLPQAHLFVDGRNLLGSEYLDVAGQRAPGRALFVGMEWRGVMD